MRISCTTLTFCLMWIAIPRCDADVARINDALEAWIHQIDSDRPFLLLDVEAGELRLQHGAALLRACAIVSTEMDSQVAVQQQLQGRLRRYGAIPFVSLGAGPFDWEQYLVQEADDDCALQFDGGLLLYADPAWEPSPAPTLRLASADLRALFDAVADSIELVVLPTGWNALADEARD
jgi:hypothetical protein